MFGFWERGGVLNFDKVFKQGLMVPWTRIADALWCQVASMSCMYLFHFSLPLHEIYSAGKRKSNSVSSSFKRVKACKNVILYGYKIYWNPFQEPGCYSGLVLGASACLPLPARSLMPALSRPLHWGRSWCAGPAAPSTTCGTRKLTRLSNGLETDRLLRDRYEGVPWVRLKNRNITH